MPKPSKRIRVKVITDGLSQKTAKKVQTYLANAIENDLKAKSAVRPTSGFPKTGTIVAGGSGFGKQPLRVSSGVARRTRKPSRPGKSGK